MTGTMAVIDTDIHPAASSARMPDFLPEPWRMRFRSGNHGSGTLGYWNPNGVGRADAVTPDGKRIEADPHSLSRYFFDLYDLEYGILNPGSALHYGLSPESDYAAALVSAVNDVFVNDWLPTDSRFRLSLSVAPQDPELAAREIHRLGDHPGVVQVILPSAARIAYGQRFYHPIFAAAAEHDLPVAIHPGTEGVGISGAPTATGYPTSYFEWHTDLVCSYIGHVTSMIAEGVFKKFPTLRFVLIEGGVSWLPPVLWRMDKNWKALRMTIPWVDRLPSEIAREHILLTTQPLEEPERPEWFHTMLGMFDAAHMLLFSTDFPHWDGDTPDFAAKTFPKELRSRVLSETARELYRLPAAKPATAEAALSARR